MEKWLRLSWIFLGVALWIGLLATLLPAQAAPNATIRYVSSVSGEDTGTCTDDDAPCRTLQYAADQAQIGDELRIAATDNGSTAIYTGTGTAPVLSVDKSLTLGGGYIYLHGMGMSAWQRGVILAISQIDGEAQRQGIHASGAPTLTLEWLALSNGHATSGGNLYAENVDLRFNAVIAISGTADMGGGLYLKNCDTAFDPVEFDIGDLLGLSGALGVWRNSAQLGGGIYIEGGSPALTALVVVSNTATEDGGGLYLAQGEPIIGAAIVEENLAGQRGGGLFLEESYARIAASGIHSNTAPLGGGLYLDGPLASWPINVPIIANNYVRHNQGGGFYFNRVIAGVVNNVVADNSALEGSTDGLGAYLYAASPYLIHNTFANNAGSAIYITHQPGQTWPPASPIPSLPQLTNNIITSHTLGIYAQSTGLPYPLENRVTMEGTLWWGNGADTGGPGQIVTGNDVNADPDFICTTDLPECLRPYHLEDTSPAIDAGVALMEALPDDEAFLYDIDLQLRPAGDGYDIGADEVVTRTLDVWLLPPLSTIAAEPGETVTHTHRLLNTGTETETFDLTLESDTTWATIEGPAALTLGAQTSATVHVRVAVPLETADGVSDTTRLVATARSDEDISAQALDVTLVSTEEILLYDAGLDKWADETLVPPGDTIHYTLLVTQSADITTALAVTLSDTFVPTQALATWQLPPACDGVTTTGVITCAWTLQPGSLQIAHPLVVTTNDAYSGTLLNLASISADILETDLSNNFAQETVLISADIYPVYLPLVLKN